MTPPLKMHRTTFLSYKDSTESFASPAAVAAEALSASGGRRRRVESTSSPGGLRRLKSLGQLQVRKDPLPDIPELCVTRRTFVNVRPKGLARWIWTRQHLRMTKHTLSLHQTENSPALDIIVLCKVLHIGQVKTKSRCLHVEPSAGNSLYIAFDNDNELHEWLADIRNIISPEGARTGIEHLSHVVTDNKDNKAHNIRVAEEWIEPPVLSRQEVTTRQTILPEITLANEDEPILDINPSFLFPRPASPESFIDTDGEDEAVIRTARLAIRPTTQRLLAMKSDKQPSRLTIQDVRVPLSTRATLPSSSEESPSTPQLTPDASPMTPFRESPYSYRETDAKDLSGQIHTQNKWPDAHGGNADIWRAQWHAEFGVALPAQVAVKVLRVLSQDESIQKKIQRRLRNEVRVWHQLRHANVVQLLGTCDGFSPFISMVSRWYEHGNVNTYLLKLGDAGTVERRLKLLKEAAAGLNYLHHFSFPVVHGDVKGANILVNDLGEAALADFGLSSILQVAGDYSTSAVSGGSVRWMAPELFLSPYDTRQKTRASDTYSYGSVILEILTGDKPFKDISNDMQVINELLHGFTPKRPLRPFVNSGVWELMERCWTIEVCERPSMAFVLSRIEAFYDERRKSMLPEEMLGYAL